MVFECRYLHFQKMRFRGTFRFIFIYASFRNSVTLRFADYISTIKDADRIVVIDKGQVSESGTYSELITLNGVFQRLWQAQTNVTE